MELKSLTDAIVAIAAFGGLCLGIVNCLANLRRRKPHAKVSFVKCCVTHDPPRHEYRVIRVANNGEIPFVVTQIGLAIGKSGETFIPIGENDPDVKCRPRLDPGDVVDRILPDDIYWNGEIRNVAYAFAQLASGDEFRSEPISEDLSALAILGQSSHAKR